MNKIVFLVLLVISMTCSLYSQANSILLIRSNGAKYKKIEIGIKSAINKSIPVKSIVFRNETEVINTIRANSPKIIVVMGMDLIKVWKKIQLENQNINQIPSILLENEFSGINLGDLSNVCIVSYEPKLKNYIENFNKITGKKPQNIGVVYSSRSRDLVKSYQNESSLFNSNLHAKAVVASDPENSIKTIVDNFTNHYNTDLIIILDDHVIINNENINSTWVPVLSPIKIQVAVPSDYFYELEPKIGTFAIQPHYSEIGYVIASVINIAEANNWKLKHKSIYTDKTVFYSRNKNGSISKKNQIQNKVIASFHPQTESPPETQVSMSPQNPEKNNTDQKQTLSDSIVTSTIESEKPADPVVETKTVGEEPLTTLSAVEKKSVSNKKSQVSTSKTVTKDKKVQSEIKKQKSETKKQYTEPTVSSKIPDSSKEESESPQLSASDNEEYEIVITSKTSNIYKELTSDLPVLGIGRSGDVLKVMSEDSLWYCVDFFGTYGFLSKEDACSLSQKGYLTEISEKDHIATIIAVIFLIALIFLFILLFVIKKSKRGRKKKINCLMITKKIKRIKYSNINDKHITLIKYLKNFGFHVRVSKNVDQISTFLLFSLPDIIFIDWQIEVDVQGKIYEILKEQMFSEDYMLVFYNVTDPSEISKDDSFDNRTFFLSKKFTISDLNKILLMVKVKFDTPQQLSDQSNSYLEGRITEETLSEIVHMMDINKKTGCLLVKNLHPVGMIFFEEGLITYAMTNSKVAEQAVFDILSMKSGSFQFLPGKKPTTRQMELDVMSALMENAKFVDENLDNSSKLIG
ncbi:MAG: DUF4388 domain-containing protein [Fibrobacter sp.]|nr:DUF4388 domain-containing protein [Fibrobacter sp.]